MDYSDNKAYFNKAQESASERYMNASGKPTAQNIVRNSGSYFADANSCNYDFEMFDDELNFDDELVNSDATPSSNYSASQPYILSIENISGGNISSVVVLGARQNLSNAGVLPWNWGNNGAITISMGVSNITYPQFLFQTLTNAFTVGTIYLHSSTNAQATTPITIEHSDANGNLVQKVITPVVDPYQNQTGVIEMKENFSVDGDTMLTIATMYASTILTMFLYPTNIVNPRLVLSGQNLHTESNRPNIVEGQVLSLSQSQVNELKIRK